MPSYAFNFSGCFLSLLNNELNLCLQFLKLSGKGSWNIFQGKRTSYLSPLNVIWLSNFLRLKSELFVLVFVLKASYSQNCFNFNSSFVSSDGSVASFKRWKFWKFVEVCLTLVSYGPLSTHPRTNSTAVDSKEFCQFKNQLTEYPPNKCNVFGRLLKNGFYWLRNCGYNKSFYNFELTSLKISYSHSNYI